MLAVGSMVTSGLSDMALERYTVRFQAEAANPNAELLRCMFWNEAFKIPVAVVLFLALDTAYLEKGIFHGWTWKVFGLTAGMRALASGVVNISVPLGGALLANLAQALEIVVVFFLEATVLQTVPTDASTILFIIGMCLVAVAFNLTAVDIMNAKATLMESLRESIASKSGRARPKAQPETPKEQAFQLASEHSSEAQHEAPVSELRSPVSELQSVGFEPKESEPVVRPPEAGQMA
mmetsp:Transcript_39133/g.108854  ORF Transcript_39133/g.108854 Transcript_39133/m.108854 type:complete len:236 (-) Transcript_39133:54-761(-)